MIASLNKGEPHAGTGPIVERFRLCDADMAVALIVRWPDGTRKMFKVVLADLLRAMRIDHG